MISLNVRQNGCNRLLGALACLVLLITLPCATAVAKDGRDFAGSYKITKAVHSGTDVTVTISLTFLNYGDEPLGNAKVALKDLLHPSKDHGAFGSLVSLEKRGSAELSGTFKVSQAEYDLWLRGAQPQFVVIHKVNGQDLERPITVVRAGVQE